jgi:hypothetical protein
MLLIDELQDIRSFENQPQECMYVKKDTFYLDGHFPE